MSEARFLFRESKEVSSLVRFMQKTWQSLYFNSKHDCFSAATTQDVIHSNVATRDQTNSVIFNDFK